MNTTKRLIYTISIILGCSVSIVAVGNEYPVAVVTDVSSSCAVYANDEKLDCDLLSELFEGQTVSLESNQSITLFYEETGIEYSFTGPLSVELGPTEPSNEIAAKSSRDLNIAALRAYIPGNEDVVEGTVTFRMVTVKGLELLYPLNTIIQQRPTFAWKKLPSAKSYRVFLFDQEGNEIWQTMTLDTEVELDQNVKLDESHRYKWELVADTGGIMATKKDANFQVLDSQANDELKSTWPDDNASFSEQVAFIYYLKRLNLSHLEQQEKQRLGISK